MHKRTALKNRVHALLFQHRLRAPVDDLFGVGGRRFLERTQLSEPWHSTLAASLHLIDVLEEQIAGLERELCRQGAEHRYVGLLMSCPGVGWVLGSTIAAEIGDIARFATAAKLVGYTGLCPRVRQSGEVDRRGALSKHGPPYLRWGPDRGGAQRDPLPPRLPRPRRAYPRPPRPETRRDDSVARSLAEAIWWMLTRNQPFAPAGATIPLTA